MSYKTDESVMLNYDRMVEDLRHQEVIKEMRSAKRVNAIAVMVSAFLGACAGSVITWLLTR